MTRPDVLPSAICTASAPRIGIFRGSMAGLCAPLSTRRRNPRGQLRMTRGRCGSLLLHRKRLALSTPCRSPGASQMFSGLPLKADIAQCSRHVSKVPGPEVEGSLTTLSETRCPRCCHRGVGEGSVMDVPGRPQSIGLALPGTVLSALSTSEYCWDPSQSIATTKLTQSLRLRLSYSSEVNEFPEEI